MSFLDENCLVFDNEDENKLEYTGIHNVRKKRIKMLCRNSRKWWTTCSQS